MEKIYKALPWLKLWNAPNLFSMDEDLDAGEKPEYPEPRGLDSLKVRVKRQGKICKLTFTDLCEDEQLFALSCMSIDALTDEVDSDYWKATEGNVKKSLYQLLSMAHMRPDGVWDGD